VAPDCAVSSGLVAKLVSADAYAVMLSSRSDFMPGIGASRGARDIVTGAILLGVAVIDGGTSAHYASQSLGAERPRLIFELEHGDTCAGQATAAST
jgi:hypothetical protein